MTTIWTGNGGANSTVNANSTLKSQLFVATANQEKFVLTNFSYTPGTGSLLIVYNGAIQTPTSDFYEVDSTTFQLAFKANAGDKILALGFVGISGIVNTPAISQFFTTASDGQTVFGTSYSYTPGANMSAVYVNGARLYVGRDYIETAGTIITLKTPRKAGDELLFVLGLDLNSISFTGQIPSVNSDPVGTPTLVPGLVPMLFNVNNNKLWVYNGSWKFTQFG